MVLRGAQFQRSGPAGCAFVTRQAFSSYRAMFVKDSSVPFARSEESEFRAGTRCDSTVERSVLGTSQRTRVVGHE
jgi:hypothetical protein